MHHQLCNALQGWAIADKAQSNLESLVGHSTHEEFKNIHEVYASLSNLKERFEGEGDIPTARRIDAYLAFIEYAYFREPLPLDQYFNRMTGLAFEVIPENRVQDVKKLVLREFSRINIDFDKADEQLQRLEPRLTPETYLMRMGKIIGEDNATIQKAIGRKVDVPYEVSIKPMNRDCMAQCGYHGGAFRIVLNAGADINSKFTASIGNIRHEFCGHAIQGALIKEEVEAKRLPLSLGYQTALDPSLVQAEGIAESVSALLPAVNGMETAWRVFREYRAMIMFNAAVMRKQQGSTTAMEYYEAAAPFFTREKCARNIGNTVGFKPFAYYDLVYGPASHAFNSIARALGPRDFGAFIGKVMPKAP
ncbi:MAG: hypothetical protein KGQ41_09960, partial [Alphaproteobacteria bacterium]|nr:hypothetical protein [Alphaproteobacteria bacterium]